MTAEINAGERNDSVTLVWQYESGKKCRLFAQEEIQLINLGLKANNRQVYFAQRRGEATVDLQKMTKKKEKSGWEVKIRWVVTSGACGGHFLWIWINPQGEQNLFSPQNMIDLEKAYATKSNIILADNWADWTINLQSMEMKYVSSVTQKIQRVSAETCMLFPKTNDKCQMAKASLDAECSAKIGMAHVYCEDDVVWDVMLNQTNIEYNNNKFYVIQLLEDDASKTYSVWSRWGRVGQPGHNSLQKYGPHLDIAKEFFRKKFMDKTGNEWNKRDSFKKADEKYDMLKIDYSQKGYHNNSAEEVKKSVPIPESKLEPSVRALVELICDVQAMEDEIMEMQYDTNKSPLGTLTAEQIKVGYLALKVIDDLIQRNIQGPRLLHACNDFYTRIPHNFGKKTPPLITTKDEIRKKINLLEALGDIHIALNMMHETSDVLEHPTDKHYRALRCELTPLENQSSEFKLLEDYLQNTNARADVYAIKLLNLYRCTKQDEHFKDIGNRMLLWHGSRLTNWAGILGKGLHIAPPEAPVTGYMFGKGVYFADMSSTSATYCFATRKRSIVLMMLCEVALGQINELQSSDYSANRLPPGKHSVKALGRIATDSASHVMLTDGTKIPTGKPVDNSITNHCYAVDFNEYVVYNTNQIRMRYLLKVKFMYKK